MHTSFAVNGQSNVPPPPPPPEPQQAQASQEVKKAKAGHQAQDLYKGQQATKVSISETSKMLAQNAAGASQQSQHATPAESPPDAVLRQSAKAPK
jgi:hypothetical protein